MRSSASAAIGYKRPGIIRAGFRYQDLVAIEVLIRFYRDRTLYQWVELDSDDKQFGAVDDVVACRPDGRFELLQVKFTPDPSAAATALNWSWLLSHRPKGTSLLRKWSQTVGRHALAGGLASAGLRTDRIPDPAVAACLVGSRIDFRRVDAEVQAEIVKQIGSTTDAEAFFAVFDFHHSEPILEDLENRLRSDVAFDIDGSAWLSFRDAVESWATLKYRPEPDGRILHEHLRQVLSLRRPRPLPQDFEVPAGYQPPDAEFADSFLRKISEVDGVTVLVGPPGRGKSTFLSHCVEELSDEGLIVIRHHYFLDLADKSAGRFHYNEIANSLTSQLRAQSPGASYDPNDLSSAIVSSGQAQADAGKRLVIVIDGLDHVWREGRSKEHMAQLFAELLPIPRGVALVVGTQPAPDEELPVKLLQHAPRAAWMELPLMSQDAVSHWLKEQDVAGRLIFAARDLEVRSRERATLAAAFFEISGGLPLHLIYAFEDLARTGAPLTVEIIEALPSCPSGDIRLYYAALWSRVGARGQDILHVLAALLFAMPPLSLRQLFAEPGDADALARIDHLLNHRDLGVYPFHGSLFAFVQEQSGSASALAAHREKILTWLSQSAPPYWRWAWLWLTQAQLGDDVSLVNAPDRPWVLAALAAAYPIDQISRILRAAEEAAFLHFDLPRTLELRLLRLRVQNGAEFQTDRWDLFLAAAVEVTADLYPLAELRADLLDLDTTSMALVLRRASPSERTGLARQAVDEFNRRLKRLSKRSFNWPQDLPDSIGQVIAHLSKHDGARFVAFCQQFQNPDAPLTAFAREALRMQQPRKVLELAGIASGPEFNTEVFTAACLERLDPFNIGLEVVEDPRRHALSLLLGGAPPPLTTPLELAPLFEERDLSGGNVETRSLLSSFFFRAFCAAFAKGEVRPVVAEPSASSDQAWLVPVLENLADMAEAVAKAWSEYGEPPTMAALYAGLNPTVSPEGSYEVHARYQALRQAILDIGIDLQVLSLAVARENFIDEIDITTASESPFWLNEGWLHAFSTRPLRLHTQAGAQALADLLFKELDQGVTQFAERTELWIRLSLFCGEHGLTQAAAVFLQRAANGLIGYGWRKDVFGYEVLTTLELLHEHGDSDAVKTLLSLAPILDQITEFTDGDETDHIKIEFYKLLARYAPQQAARAYGYLIHCEEWRYANELLLELVSTLPPGPRREALLSTFIQPTEQRWLASRDRGKDSDGLIAIARVKRYLGPANVDDTEKQKPESTSSMEPQFDLSSFGPDKLNELVSALKEAGIFNQRNILQRWFSHWACLGQGHELLRSLEASRIDDALRDFSELYDEAFRLSLKLEGRSAAFKWLVVGHRANYGWQRWHSSHDDAIARLDAVAEHYPERWREFVQETARTRADRRRDQPLVLGLSRLIYLLLKVGEKELARAIAEKMVGTLRAETKEQPLPVLGWAS
ncbi:NACHT domain-containing protein [Reyranella aquatilis]|uniref:NACHT domain-containing protein n=1 Tax=Reyranella aquatilis TaxID=2035356 RepID=A0ABS8L1Q4_9HYPH|nr:AAA family ATPase [Reyranella aquatilis]MCC8432266.1 NACHT domain-containing protein [Reyranella aquatilis]